MALKQEFITILWKNFLIRRRHYILTITEIIIPILLFVLLTYGRSKVPELTKVQVGAKINDRISEDAVYLEFSTENLHLWYTPQTNFTDRLIEKLRIKFQIPGEDVEHFASEKDLLQQGVEDDNAEIVAIVFDVENPNHLKYDLRIYEKYLIWETNKLFLSDITLNIYENSYLRRFAALQLALDKAFIELSQNVDEMKETFSLQEFPYPPQETDLGLTNLLMNFMPLIIILSFIFLCSSVLKRVIEEKTCGVKEYMKMVGMKPWMMYVGWILYAFTSNVISIAIIVWLVKTPLWDVEFPLIEYTSGTLFFMFLLLYCLAAVAMCFFIASFWNNPSMGMLFGVIFWILSYYVPIYINNKSYAYSKAFKTMLSLFPNMALYYGFSAMQHYESRKIGLQWSNFYQPGNGGDKEITMFNIFVIFILELFVLTLLANYIDNVKPGEYGIAKPIGYPLTNLLKKLKRNTKKSVEDLSSHENEIGLLHIERGDGKTPCIEIQRLNKRYGPTNAVDDLTWTIYKDQITILLGQNGAGKTTTMSMLTGMISASSGTIEINGKNLKDNISEIRENLGLCPQENLLFPDLTVFEHLKFFSMLKGRNCTEAANEAKEMITKVGLNDKLNSLANTLSGGMKRKLCLCMALMGDPKVLILDEPTSGMDPETREKICTMLLEIRKSKTILISTHHMDDAEMLGDWIAVMANGRLQCYGTPIYLKEKYNTGYHLSVTSTAEKYKEDTINNLNLKDYADLSDSHEKIVYQFENVAKAQEIFNKFKDFYNIQIDNENLTINLNLENDLEKCIETNMPNAKKLNAVGQTQIYLLRTVDKDEYTKLLKCLENRFPSAKISLTITTLDNVLESVRGELSENDGTKGSEEAALIQLEDTKPTENTQSHKILALFCKRKYFLIRKWYLYAPAIAALFACILFAMLLARGSTENLGNDGPTFNFVLNPYEETTVYYQIDKTITNWQKLIEIYKKISNKQLGQPVQVENITDAILGTGIENIALYKKQLIVATEFENNENDKIHINALYSSVALHSLPISINLAMNTIAKTLLGENYEISTSITPLKLASTQHSPSELSLVQIAVIWIVYIPMGMLMFTSCFLIFPHFEISSNFLEIQHMTGVGSTIYWIVNFLTDFGISFIGVLVSSGIFLVTFEGATLRGAGALLAILLAYSIYGLPFVYAMSFSKTLASGISRVVTFGILLGIVPTIVVLIMEASGMEVYEFWGKIIKYVLMATTPPFSLTYIMVRFSQSCITNYNWNVMLPNKKEYLCKTTYVHNPCCSETCDQFTDYFVGEFGIVTELAVSFVTVIAFFLAVEWKTILKLCKKFIKTFRTITNTTTDTYDNQNKSLIVKDLEKSNRVKNVTFDVDEKECFGLLGVNGAGKSTTFKILTKKESKDKGCVRIKSLEGIKDLNDDEYLKNFGYCPQIDSLNYALSGQELIEVIAMLRGFSSDNAKKVAKAFIELFDLEKYKDKPCLTYSGGNKRKLSTCLAFVSSPNVILLDEPTSGVDPVSRHKFWDVLKGFKSSKKKKSSFILCSHSMDECEVLCDRIAIMKEGKIEAAGGLAELKQKYAKGYKIQLKLRSQEISEDCVDGPSLVERLKKNFEDIFGKDNCVLKDEHSGQLYYQVKEIQSLSKTFEDMEDLKNRYSCIENYSVTDNTLKDILINIANKDK